MAGWRLSIGAAALLLAVSWAAVLLRPAMPVVETRYLSVAWEMWVSGDYVLPALNGETYAEKPPLLFWLIALAWALSGESDLAARMVGPLAGAAAVLLTAGLARRLWPEDPARAGRAALMLATSGAFLAYSGTVMFDALLTAFVVAALWTLWSVHAGGGRRAALAAGALIGAGVLTKGPVMLLHVAPVMLLHPLWAGPAPRLSLGAWARAMGLVLLTAAAVTFAWLGPALALGDAEYRATVLWRQTAGRLSESFAHAQPAWFFAALLPALLWPWGWTARGLGALSPRRAWADAGGRFALVGCLGALAGFSAVSGKQVHYVLPQLAGLALLLSGGDWSSAPGRVRTWPRLLLLAPAAPVLLAGAAIRSGMAAPPPGSGIVAPVWALVAAGAILAIAGAAMMRPRAPLPALALAAPATVLALTVLAAPTLRATYDAAAVGRALAAHEAAGLALSEHSYLGEFNHAARLRAPLARLRDAQAESDWIAAHPGGALITASERSDPRLSLVLRSGFRGGTYLVYRVAERSSPDPR